MSEDSAAYEGWAVVELMGHRRIAGHVSEVAQYGTAMIRIDVPTTEGPPITQFYGGQSIYCVSPVSEEAARAVALRNKPAPVSPYEVIPPSLPKPTYWCARCNDRQVNADGQVCDRCTDDVDYERDDDDDDGPPL